jgi:Mg2+-importing ATPase
MAIALITLIISYIFLASVLGFQALPFSFVLILIAIVALYVTSAEIVIKN